MTDGAAGDAEAAVMEAARAAARRRGHAWIGTEHVLLALLEDKRTLARKLMEAAGVDRAEVRRELDRRIPPPDRDRDDALAEKAQLPFTPDLARALQSAQSESVGLGHHYIGTQHLLLGLAAARQGAAGSALEEAGVTLRALRGAAPAVS